jgi:protocatechuate 3,4-dioxygenase beta subunit
VAGRVALPRGTPRDDTLSVVAVGAPRESDDDLWGAQGGRSWDAREELGRAPVAADGAFRLELAGPVDDDSLALDLDGRFLFLHEPLALAGDAAPVLEPELGGALRLRLDLPAGATEVPAVTVAGAWGMDYQGASMARAATLEDGLEVELRALQTGLHYSLWATPDVYPGTVVRDDVAIEPGRVVEARVPLEAGATVRGRVVDADGAPLAGATVRGDHGASIAPRPDGGEAMTDAQGRFELRGLAARPQALTARLDDYLDGETATLELANGSVHEDVTIALELGLELGGTVRWPDGAPAEGARLTVVPLEPGGSTWRMFEAARSPEGQGATAADGSFRLAGLEPGAYAVHVARPALDDAEGAAWTARAASVEAGSTDLALTLVAPLAYAARVVDDAGEPVAAFTVTAQRADWPTWLEGPSRELEETFEDADGRFALAGVDAGRWTVSVTAEGHLRSDDREVAVAAGAAADPTAFALTRTARITGVVRDPAGLPVAGAEVRGMALEYPAHSAVETTDEEGRFVLASVGPGPVALEASCDAWAPSVEERHDLVAGEARADVAVLLTEGGTIEGVVYDRDGAPDAGRTIALQSNDGEFREVESDSAGRFRAERLAPGVYQVIATPDPDVWESVDGEQPDLGELFEEVRMSMATVVEGELAEVVLGAPPRAPVVVHGRVTLDGEPLAHAGVMVLAESTGIVESLRADSADEDGRYEVRLDEPGEYTIVVMGSPPVEAEVDFQVSIPEVERHALDLELPLGAIAGRVRLADGSVPRGASLWIRREDGTSDLSALMSTSSVSMDEDGSFRVGTLHPGRYAISAIGGESAFTTVHDVEVTADAETSGVDLVLAPAGRVAGVVVDATGAGVPGATVLLRDDAGRPLYRLETSTDHDGRFELERVPLGEVLVSARTDARVSTEEQAARVTRDGAGEVRLELGEGVLLRVVLVDEDGEPVRAAIRVEDEAGFDHAGCTSRDELEQLAVEGVSATERRVGPLAPGRYAVSARTADGRTAERSVTLRAGSDERSTRLRLRD